MAEIRNDISNKEKPDSKEVKRDKAVSAVVSAKMKETTKKGFKKVLTAFVEENPETLITNDPDNIKVPLFKVLVPEIKKTIIDIVHVIIYRNGKVPSYRSSLPGSKVLYGSWEEYYARKKSGSEQSISREAPARKTVFGYDNVLFVDRGEAELAKKTLEEMLKVYPVVTIADYYESIGLKDEIDYTACNYGWKDVSRAYVYQEGPGEWRLIMPKAIPID